LNDLPVIRIRVKWPVVALGAATPVIEFAGYTAACLGRVYAVGKGRAAREIECRHAGHFGGNDAALCQAEANRPKFDICGC
jgi:hypothetical protein